MESREPRNRLPVASLVLKQPQLFDPVEAADVSESDIMRLVQEQLGAVVRPARMCFVGAWPTTRSGKVLRRAIEVVCEGSDPGDLTTIENPRSLENIKEALQ